MLQRWTERIFGVDFFRVFARWRLGQRRDQSSRVFVARLVENIFRRAAFHNLALVKNADTVAESRNRQQVMRNVENGGAHLAVQPGKQFQYFRLRDGIESAGWLVREQQGRAMKRGHGNTNALPLANAQLRGTPPKKFLVGRKRDAG